MIRPCAPYKLSTLPNTVVGLREIGRLFDVGETVIVEASRWFSLKLGEDKKLKELVERVKGELKI
jgi:hypothetical protein